jgi:16S rRNA (guanine(966)-N(2))-methyltransferase RsmD
MRVIAGTLKGRHFEPPSGLGIRPTTDKAREALFNILMHRYELEGIKVLDLFAGSGGVSLEFISRGAEFVQIIEKNRKVVSYLFELFNKYNINNVHILQYDALQFIYETNDKFDLVFLDPPYSRSDKETIISKILNKDILINNGIIILEHPALENYKNVEYFLETRIYGTSAFSFFIKNE